MGTLERCSAAREKARPEIARARVRTRRAAKWGACQASGARVKRAACAASTRRQSSSALRGLVRGSGVLARYVARARGRSSSGARKRERDDARGGETAHARARERARAACAAEKERARPWSSLSEAKVVRRRVQMTR